MPQPVGDDEETGRPAVGREEIESSALEHRDQEPDAEDSRHERDRERQGERPRAHRRDVHGRVPSLHQRSTGDDRDREQEGELRRIGRIQTHPQGGGDRRAGARDAAQERGDRLRETNHHGTRDGRLRSHAMPPFRRPEGDSGDGEADPDENKAGGRLFHLLVEENAEDGGGNRGDHQQPGPPERRPVTGQRAPDDAPEPRTIHNHNREERGDVQGDFDENAGRLDAGEHLDDAQVSRAGHRQELREALHQPENHALPPSHTTLPSTSAATPRGMASFACLTATGYRCPERARPALHTSTSATTARAKYHPPYPASAGRARLAGMKLHRIAFATFRPTVSPERIGTVRRPSTRSPGTSTRSFATSRPKCSHPARIQGTSPAAPPPTLRAPYISGNPATRATVRFPATPRRLRQGEYAAISTSAPHASANTVPLTSAAVPSPRNAPQNTSRSTLPRRTRPDARGRSVRALARSPASSQMSLRTFPATPSPTPETAAHTRGPGAPTRPSAIHPPAKTPRPATTRLCARTSRSRSTTEEIFVEPLVLGHDLVDRERLRAFHGGRPHPGRQRRVLEDLERV